MLIIEAPIGRLGQKCAIHAKKWVFGAKSQFFVWESRFLSTGHITSTPGAIAFPIGPTQKNFMLGGMGHFGRFWAKSP